MVERGQIGGQQQHHLRQLQIIDRVLGQPFHPPHRVITEVADHPAGERGQTGQPFGAQQLQGFAQRVQGIAAGRRARGGGAQPGGGAVHSGERGRAAGADERPARPGPPVLR